MRMTRQRMFLIFFAVAFLGSYAIAFAFAPAWTSSAARAINIAYALPVLLATLLLQGPIMKQPVLGPLGLSMKVNRWWFVAWLLPVVWLALAVALGALLFSFEVVTDAAGLLASKRGLLPVDQLEAFDQYALENPPAHPLWLVAQALPAGITLNLLIALAEELGFRGFLFREVRGGFWRRSFVIGALWSAWLVPTVLFGNHFPEDRIFGAFSLIAFGFLSSPILVYLRIRSGSVIAVAATRGTLMALTHVAADVSVGATALTRPFYGVSGVLAAALVMIGLIVVDRQTAHPILFRPAKVEDPASEPT